MADIPPLLGVPPTGFRDESSGEPLTPVLAVFLNSLRATVQSTADALNTADVPEALASLISGGGAPVNFTYTATTPSVEWVIDHPLPHRPNVAVVYVGDTSARLVPVEYPTPGRVVIRNGAPARGAAYLS